MMWLKGCPRCRGDLYDEPSIGPHAGSAYNVTCLQCGHVLTRAQELALRQYTAKVLGKDSEKMSNVA